MRRARDTISLEEVRQVVVLDDICLDFVHEVTTGVAPPYNFQRIVLNGAPSLARASDSPGELIENRTKFHSNLRRIIDQQLQDPGSVPVHEVISDWLVDAWTGAVFGPATTVECDERGVVVARARDAIGRSKLISGIENMIFDLQGEWNIARLGINEDFAVFDDKVSVWLGPMRLVGFGCKKCQNTRYVKNPIDCTVNLPDGADLQFLAASRPIGGDSILWTYAGETYTPTCACPPPEKKPPKIARANSLSLQPQKRTLKLIYKYPGSASSGDESVELPPPKRFKQEVQTPPLSLSVPAPDTSFVLEKSDEACIEDLFADERELEPEGNLGGTPVPESASATQRLPPPRRRLPTPSVSPEPFQGDMDKEESAASSSATADAPKPTHTVATPASAKPPKSKTQTTTQDKQVKQPSTSKSTANSKSSSTKDPSRPKGKAHMPPPDSAPRQGKQVPPALSSKSKSPSTIEDTRAPSPLVSAAILSSLSHSSRSTTSSSGESSRCMPLVETASPGPQSEVLSMTDLPVEDSSERSTFIPTSPSGSSTHAYRPRPRLLPKTTERSTSASTGSAGTDRERSGTPPRRLSTTPEESLREAQLQVDWLRATRSMVEAGKARAEQTATQAEAENSVLRSITDSMQQANNATQQENLKLKEENERMLRELGSLRRVREEYAHVRGEVEQMRGLAKDLEAVVAENEQLKAQNAALQKRVELADKNKTANSTVRQDVRHTSSPATDRGTVYVQNDLARPQSYVHSVQVIKDELDRVYAESKELKAKIAALELEIKTREESRVRELEVLRSLQDEHAKVREEFGQMRDLTDDMEALVAENESLKAREDRYMEDVRKLRKVEAENRSKQSEIRFLEEVQKEMEETHASLIKDTEANERTMKGEIRTLRKTRDELLEARDKAGQMPHPSQGMDALNAENEQLKAKQSAYEEDLRTLGEENRQLQVDVIEQRTKTVVFQAEGKIREDRMLSELEVLRNVKDQYAKVREEVGQMRSLTEDMEGLVAENERLKARQSPDEGHLRRLREENNKLRSESERLHENIEELQSFVDMFSEAERQMDAVHQRTVQLERKLVEEAEVQRKTRAALQKLELKVLGLEWDKRELEDERLALVKDKHALENHNQLLEDSNRMLENAKKELEEQKARGWQGAVRHTNGEHASVSHGEHASPVHETGSPATARMPRTVPTTPAAPGMSSSHSPMSPTSPSRGDAWRGSEPRPVSRTPSASFLKPSAPRRALNQTLSASKVPPVRR